MYVNILSLLPCFRCEVLPWPDTFPQYGFYGPCDFSFVVSSVPGKLGPNSWAPEPNWPLLKTVKFILFLYCCRRWYLVIRMMFNNIVILNGDYVIQDDYLLSERKYIVVFIGPRYTWVR